MMSKALPPPSHVTAFDEGIEAPSDLYRRSYTEKDNETVMSGIITQPS